MSETQPEERPEYPGLQYAGTAFGCRVHVGAWDDFGHHAWWGREAPNWSGAGEPAGRDLASGACAQLGALHVTPEVLAALDTWVPWSERVATEYDERRRSLSESAHVEDRFNAEPETTDAGDAVVYETTDAGVTWSRRPATVEPVAYACTKCNDTGQRPAGLLGWHGARECDCEAAQPSEPLPILTVEGGRVRLHLDELSEGGREAVGQLRDAYRAIPNRGGGLEAEEAALWLALHDTMEPAYQGFPWGRAPHLRAIEDAHRALEVAQCRAATDRSHEIWTAEHRLPDGTVIPAIKICTEPTDSRHLAHTPPEERLPAQEKLSAQETDGDQ